MSEYHTPPEARPDRRRTWLVRGLVALVCYALFGFFAVPALINWQLPPQASKQLGRSVSLDDAHFNPFSLTLRLDGLRIKEADGERIAASVGAIETDLQWRSIYYWGLVFSRLTIDAPQLVLARVEGEQTNWSDVIARFATQDEPPPPDEDAGPLRFSVNNIRITNGEIDINDQPAGLIHTVRALNVGIPFISGFPAQVERYVQPELSAVINGAPLQLSGRTRPFGEDLATIIDIQLAPFDIAPYLAYLPYKPDFRIKSGQLATALELAFAQPTQGAPKLSLIGTATLTELTLTDSADGRLLTLPRLHAEVAEYDVFAGKLHLAEVRVAQPDLRLVRAASGAINWQAVIPPASAKRTAKAGDDTPAEAGASSSFELLLDRLSITDGRVAFVDAMAPAGTFSTTVSALTAELAGLNTAGGEPATLTLDAKTDAGETIHHEGTLVAAPFASSGKLTLDGAPLTHYAPYYANQLVDAKIGSGTLAARVPFGLDAKGFRIDSGELDVAKFSLSLKGAKTPAVLIGTLKVSGVALDTAASQLRIGAIRSADGKLQLVRARNGEIDLAGIVPSAGAQESPPKSSSNTAFGVRIDQIGLSNWAVGVTDRGVSPAVQLDATRLALTLGALDLTKPAATPVALKTVLNKTGYLAIKGKSNFDTFDTNVRVDLRKLDLRRFQSYIPQAQAIDLRSARAGLGGQLSLSALTSSSPRVTYRGNVGVTDLIARDTLNDTDFLRWKSLSLDGLDLRTEPLALGVDTVRLDDFYSRLILDAKGRLNFRELTGAEAAADDAAAPRKQGEAVAKVNPPAESLPPIRIGKIELAKGNVQYSDHFVQPNYDANLTEVKGSLDGLRSDADSVATLSLNAAIDHGAPVEITGQLNPLRQDRYLDILATVRDFQLPTISAYSGKYVGYGIAKGKLSADLSYKVEERVLTAKNDVLLDQLTFGEKVESKDAVNLPVQLAVALLRNSKGEIDLSVPVSGTLDDPKFSVGGLVWRAFFNLIVKAVTSPFALLGSMFGGGEELAYAEFAPGRDTLSAASVKKLETLAKALTERPGLKIEITGRVDPAVDTQGLRERWLLDRMREAQRERLIDAGETPPPLAQIEIPADQQDALLKEAYSEADIKKPRNLIGFAKTLPPEKMRALMLDNAPAGPELLAELGKQRAQHVRDWLVGNGKVNASRIFLVAPKSGDKAKAAPRADFSLR